MPECNLCGSHETSISHLIECVQEEFYTANEPGSPTRAVVLATEKWQVSLCKRCSLELYREYLSIQLENRDFIFVALGAVIVVMAITAGFVYFFGFGFFSIAILALFGFVLFYLLLRLPVVLYNANVAKAVNREFEHETDSYIFNDEEKRIIAIGAGEKLISRLESSQGEVYGRFELPHGLAKDFGMDNGKNRIRRRIREEPET